MGMGYLDIGGTPRKGIRYPNRRTSTTEGSAPLSLQACQWRDRDFEEGTLPLPPLKRLEPLPLPGEVERLLEAER